ncbi:MAG: DUF4416 family protein [Leptospiraceae bacterium]|nr:DUF4416 family protein [Leptospiraceae bacterium]
MSHNAKFFIRIMAPSGSRMAEALTVTEKKIDKYDFFSPSIIIGDRECRLVSFAKLISATDLVEKYKKCQKVFSRLTSDNISVLPGYIKAEHVVTIGSASDLYAIQIDDHHFAKLQLVYQKSGFSVQPGSEPEFLHLLTLSFFSGLRRSLINGIY